MKNICPLTAVLLSAFLVVGCNKKEDSQITICPPGTYPIISHNAIEHLPDNHGIDKVRLVVMNHETKKETVLATSTFSSGFSFDVFNTTIDPQYLLPADYYLYLVEADEKEEYSASDRDARLNWHVYFDAYSGDKFVGHFFSYKKLGDEKEEFFEYVYSDRKLRLEVVGNLYHIDWDLTTGWNRILHQIDYLEDGDWDYRSIKDESSSATWYFFPKERPERGYENCE